MIKIPTKNINSNNNSNNYNNRNNDNNSMKNSIDWTIIIDNQLLIGYFKLL